MGKIKYLLLILAILLSCSEKKMDQSSDLKTLYVQNIPSVEAFDSVELKKSIGNIPWNANVEGKEVIELKDSFSIIKFSYQGKEYFAKYASFSKQPPVLYMRVNVDSRLRLREKPNTNSAIIDTIPNGYVSKVNSIDPKIHSIENRKGYWFQITYNNKIGWIFSGFAITSYSEFMLTYADNLNFEPQELESNIDNLKLELKDYSVINEFTINGYDVTQAVLKNPSESDACMENVKLFISKKDGKFLYKTTEFSTSILQTDHPVKNAILIEQDYCGCCCPNVGKSIIYFGSRPQRISSLLNDQSMNCSFDYGEQSFVYEIQNKFSVENENLKLVRTPDCYEFFDSHFEMDSSQSIVPKKYTNEFFVYIKYEDTAKIEIFKNQGIPEKYKNLWENSK